MFFSRRVVHISICDSFKSLQRYSSIIEWMIFYYYCFFDISNEKKEVKGTKDNVMKSRQRTWSTTTSTQNQTNAGDTLVFAFIFLCLFPFKLYTSFSFLYNSLLNSIILAFCMTREITCIVDSFKSVSSITQTKR